MTSSAKRLKLRFTADEVLDILMNDASGGESNMDSEVGGMLREEEFELDNELEVECDQGLLLEGQRLRRTMRTALDFFRLFCTDAIMHQICTNTNLYAWRNIQHKSSYGDKDGAWVETTPQELNTLIALIIYFGLVTVRSFQHFWSTKTLYNGLWGRSMMSQRRFKALMGMLHVVDPTTEDPEDKLRKVSSFLDHFKRGSKNSTSHFKVCQLMKEW